MAAPPRNGLSREIWRRVWLLQSMGLMVAAAVTLPWLSIFLRHALLGRGVVATADLDIPGALAAPGGVLLLVILAIGWLAVELFGHAAQFVVAHEVLHCRKITVPTALALVVRHFKGLLALILSLALRSTAIALPFLLVVAAVLKIQLQQGELGDYLARRPPEFLLAVALAGLLLLCMILMLVRHLIDWLLALPLLIFHGQDPTMARRNGRRLASGHRWRLFLHLLGWLSIPPMVTAAVVVVSLPLLWWSADLFGGRIGLSSLVVGVALGGWGLSGLLARFVSATSFSAYHACLCLRAGLDAGASDRSPPGFARLPWALALGAFLIVVATLAGSYLWLGRLKAEPPIPIFAPRGFSVVAAESSIDAIEAAIRSGAYQVETGLPPGGKVHVFHDPGVPGVVRLVSADCDLVKRLAAQRADWRVGLLVRSPPDEIHGLDVDFLAIRPRVFSRDLARRAEAAGLEVDAWMADEGLDISSAVSRGARGIITTDPQLVRRVLAERSELNPAERLLLDLLYRTRHFLEIIRP